MVKPLTPVEVGNCLSHNVTPHPDGRPWTKCCSSKDKEVLFSVLEDEHTCQCLMKKPRKGKSRHDASLRDDGTSGFAGIDLLKAENGRFFCIHRKTEDGFHRECAGWAAKFTKNR